MNRSLLFIIIALALSSCADECMDSSIWFPYASPASISSTTADTVTLNSNEVSSSVHISANQEWRAVLTNGTWAHISETSGYGSAKIIVTAGENNSIHDREDILTVIPSITRRPLVFKLVQKGKILEVNRTDLTIPSHGGSSERFTFTTDGSYTITKDGDWFTFGSLGAEAKSNENNEERIGSVTITLTGLPEGEEFSKVITVRQDMQYVDLGLPSGTLWSTCNVGADRAEDDGERFAWGETESREWDDDLNNRIYDWSTYKYCNGSGNEITKYCTWDAFGIVDDREELSVLDDAAYTNHRWGWGKWRIPSIEQIEELCDSKYTTVVWTTRGYVKGCQVISNLNGASIFLPATGSCSDYTHNRNVYGIYWSRSLANYVQSQARSLTIGSDLIHSTQHNRSLGCSIRPVYVPE